MPDSHDTDDTARTLRDIRHDDGFADLDDYGVLGDGRSVALAALDGAIDWWAPPTLDAPPVFAALLDPERGGRIRLAPTDPDATVTRHYLEGTNQLSTEFTTASGRVRVTDSLNTGNGSTLPWSELARRLDGLDGEMEFDFTVDLGDGLRRWQPWVEDDERGPVAHGHDITLAVRASEGIALRCEHARVVARVKVRAGERATLGVVAVDADPIFLAGTDSIDRRLDVTTDDWRRWSEQLRWDGPEHDGVVRSALALKTLVMGQTGAVAAAATTSLPERVGGEKNWDYRYAWIRDAAFTVQALAVLGLEEEVHAAVAWLLRTIRENGPEVYVMYTLDGGVPHGVQQPDVPGYRGSRPVQIGNRATGQVQLGVFGELFSTVSQWVHSGHVLDVRTTRELADLADRCADEWRRDDAGIWELPTFRPYTSSKMNCWRALDAAARLAEEDHLPGGGRRWRGEADVIRAWVRDNCWSAKLNSYTFYAGSDELDASVLLAADTGFDRGEQMSSTIDAIGEELGEGPLLYRYSGARREEETFVACAYWRVLALARVGRFDEARTLYDRLDKLVPGPLGLMAEMCTPDGRAMGNLPQALSHLALIQAADAMRSS